MYEANNLKTGTKESKGGNSSINENKINRTIKEDKLITVAEEFSTN